MRPEDRETLFWALSEVSRRETDEPDASPDIREDSEVPDSTLEAYRQGRLSEDEARRVERWLVADPANRRRLEELAGLVPAAPSSVTRRRVLEDVGGTPVVARRRRVGWRLVLAAAAVMMIAIGLLTLRSRQPVLPAYEVQIAALTERRDAASPAAVAEAYADSMVTITATVAERARPGVEVGLYRVVGNRLERVSGDRLEALKRSGVVELEVPAAELTGSEPGVHEIFVAIGWQGKLPATVALTAFGDPAVDLAAGGRRQVHRLTLRLLADISSQSFTRDPSSDEEAVSVFHPSSIDNFSHRPVGGDRSFGDQLLDAPGVCSAVSPRDLLGVLSKRVSRGGKPGGRLV